MTKKEYIDRYIKLSSRICKEPEDYTRIPTRTHNRAMRELIALRDKLSEDREMEEAVYAELLKNEDIYIQMSVATVCLNVNLNIDAAVKILERISREEEKWLAMSAERTLKVWRGEISPNQPF